MRSRQSRGITRSGFNPRPALPRGDAPRCRRCCPVSAALFNPRPALPRAMRSSTDWLVPIGAWFQSTPLRCTGRCAVQILATHALGRRFNPRPALPQGDASTTPFLLGRGFNPRPRIATGDAKGRRRQRQEWVHAPRCHGRCVVDDSVPVVQSRSFVHARVATGRCQEPPEDSAREGFNPRPFIRAMPTSLTTSRCRTSFQSTPARCHGAMRSTSGAAEAARGFNPRPALPRGDVPASAP